MKSTLCAALLAATLLGSSHSVCAAEPAVGKKAIQIQMFKDADANQDGKVTAQEFSNFALSMTFNAYVTNSSGRISKAEYMAIVKKNPDGATAEREWKLMDPKGKGYITVQDFQKNPLAVARMKKRFHEVDKKGKGYVTLADLPEPKG